MLKEINLNYFAGRILNNQAVIFNLKNQEIICLNSSAAKIWDLINKKYSLNKISKTLAEDFKIPQDIAKKDLIDFLPILYQSLIKKNGNGKKKLPYLKKDSLYQRILKTAQNKKIPFFALMELTYLCNLKCRHCYISPLKKKELKLNSILKIIQELKSYNCLELTFSGGEPLLHPDFFAILKFAKKHNFAITIKTNGTLINSKTAYKIAKFYPYEVHLSIYSLNPKIHDFITQIPGSLEKTLRAFTMLLKEKINLKISTPLMKFNFLEYKKIKEFAEGQGVHCQADPIILMKNNYDLSPLNLRLNNEELKEFYLRNPQELKESKFLNPNKNPCGAAHRMCAISPYGDIYPCSGFKLNLGNLMENNFSTIWNSSDAVKSLREMKNKDLKDCVNCKISQYCSRCPGVAYQEEKNLLAKVKVSCSLAKITKFIKEGGEK